MLSLRRLSCMPASRIDGCNTVLAGSPRTITDSLQRLLNAAARVVSNIRKFDRGKPRSNSETVQDRAICYICSTPSCTGSMFRSESSISSEWQFTGVSKARLLSTSWTAATPHRKLPVVCDFDLPAATISSYHDIVAARSAVGRSPSPVRSHGMRCLTTSETRRSVPTISGRR